MLKSRGSGQGMGHRNELGGAQHTLGFKLARFLRNHARAMKATIPTKTSPVQNKVEAHACRRGATRNRWMDGQLCL